MPNLQNYDYRPYFGKFINGSPSFIAKNVSNHNDMLNQQVKLFPSEEWTNSDKSSKLIFSEVGFSKGEAARIMQKVMDEFNTISGTYKWT